MSRETDIKLLMDNWEEKHKNNGYKRFIRDGIVCEEKWEAQHTPRVCYFLKEAYTSNENGYNLVEDLHDCERPWTMWRKVAIWTQARKIIHDSTRERQRVFTERYAWKAAV
jgi:hypothetical protein